MVIPGLTRNLLTERRVRTIEGAYPGRHISPQTSCIQPRIQRSGPGPPKTFLGEKNTPATRQSLREVDLVHFEGVYLVHRLLVRLAFGAGSLDLVRLLEVDLVQPTHARNLLTDGRLPERTRVRP